MANPIRTITQIPIRTLEALTGDGGQQQDTLSSNEIRSAVDSALRPLTAKVDALEKELKTIRKELREVRNDTDHIRTQQAKEAADSTP